METKTKLGVGTFILLSLLTSGAYFIGQENTNQTYYCQDNQLVGICDSLSGGKQTRCYFNDTYKICRGGWTKLDQGFPTTPVSGFSVKANGETYTCQLTEGSVTSYSLCISNTQKEAYLGELV